MDKKYIHIDDLSRQVLGQREEEPRPGAWLGMRELLDQQLPVGALPVAGFAWRRYLSAALILLLISIATIGGFQVSQTNKEAALAVKGMAITSVQLPEAKSTGFGTTSNATSQTADVVGVHTGDATTIGGTSGISSGLSLQKAVPLAISNAAVLSKKGSISIATGNGIPAVAASPTASNPATISGNNAAIKQPTGTQTASLVNTSVAAEPALAFMKPVTESAEMPAVEMKVAAAKPSAVPAVDKKSVATNNPKDNPKKPGTTAAPVVVHSADAIGGKARKPVATKKNMKLVRDTIQQIQIVQRMVPHKTMRGQYETKFDTISISDLVQEKWVQSGPVYAGIGPSQDMLNTEKAQPQSAAPSLKTEDGAGNYVALSSRQTSSRKWSANTITLKERMEKAMLQLSEIRAYTGMVAGVSYTPFGKLPTYGFHLGLSHAFQLDDHWTLFGEFMYQRRMGKNLILRDDYSESYDINRNIQGGNTVYNWKTDSVEHYFKVSALQSVVVPVNLQYNINRLFFTGGVAFSYSPRINTEEIKRFHNQPTTHSFTGNPSYTQMPPGYKSGNQAVNIDDFGGRISLGYQLGAGYELSPALKLDIRCSQQFWDNSRTKGASRVSKEFYRLPSLQLSVGYRFGKSK